MMLSWQKVDAIPGWFGAHSYALWRSLLDFQAESVHGNLFEIGVWRGRSASVLASYCRDDETLYLCDIQVDEPSLSTAFEGVGAKGRNIVTIAAPSSELPRRLDLRTMHQTVRWMHIDGEHTGSAVYSELELANQIVRTDGLVVIDDFFSPRYPANTTEAVRYLEKNPFHFRLLAVAFNRGYFCRPESLPLYMDYIAGGLSRALQAYDCPSTIFKTTGPWDTDAVGITSFMPEAGSIAGPDNQPHRWHMMGARNVWSPWRHIQNGFRMFFGR
jgi:hypothetical protein